MQTFRCAGRPRTSGRSRRRCCDEPTSALDIAHQQDLLELIDSPRRRLGHNGDLVAVPGRTHHHHRSNRHADTNPDRDPHRRPTT